MRAPSVDDLVRHYVGGLLVGALRPSDEIPVQVVKHLLEPVVCTTLEIYRTDGRWPVDIGRLLDELRENEALDLVGGWPGIYALMEGWSNRVLRARELGAIEARCRVALVLHERERIAENQALESIGRWRAARDLALGAIAELEALAKGRAA